MSPLLRPRVHSSTSPGGGHRRAGWARRGNAPVHAVCPGWTWSTANDRIVPPPPPPSSLLLRPLQSHHRRRRSQPPPRTASILDATGPLATAATSRRLPPPSRWWSPSVSAAPHSLASTVIVSEMTTMTPPPPRPRTSAAAAAAGQRRVCASRWTSRATRRRHSARLVSEAVTTQTHVPRCIAAWVSAGRRRRRRRVLRAAGGTLPVVVVVAEEEDTWTSSWTLVFSRPSLLLLLLPAAAKNPSSGSGLDLSRNERAVEGRRHHCNCTTYRCRRTRHLRSLRCHIASSLKTTTSRLHPFSSRHHRSPDLHCHSPSSSAAKVDIAASDGWTCEIVSTDGLKRSPPSSPVYGHHLPRRRLILPGSPPAARGRRSRAVARTSH